MGKSADTVSVEESIGVVAFGKGVTVLFADAEWDRWYVTAVDPDFATADIERELVYSVEKFPAQPLHEFWQGLIEFRHCGSGRRGLCLAR